MACRGPGRGRAAWLLAGAGLLCLALLIDWGWRGGLQARAAAWYTLETPHFRVHFRPGYEPTALQAAAVAERAVAQLGTELGAMPPEPVHLVLDDVSDLANGYTEATYYGRVVLFPVFPVGLGYTTGLSPRMRDWLELLVVHELTHAVHLEMARGAPKGLRDLFGHVPYWSTPNLSQPVAFLEGIATYEETRWVPGSRGHDPLFEMFLRTKVLANSLLDLDQALGMYDLGVFQPTGTVYLYGYAWFDFLARRFGPDAVRDLQQGWAALQFARPDDATRQLFGQPFSDLWGAMRQELRERLRGQAEAIRAEGVTPATQLDSRGWVAVGGRVSPDGHAVAYAAEGPYIQDLRLLELAGPHPTDRQLAIGLTVAPGGITWAPGGDRLVFSAVDQTGEGMYADLYEITLPSARIRRLTRGERAYAPTFSPGGRLAYVARQGLENQLMVMDPPTAGEQARAARVAWTPPGGWQLLSLAWSPRGDRLAAGVWRPGGMSDIAVLAPDRETGRLQVAQWVTQDAAVDDRPAWTRDGRYLLFHSDRSGVYNLYAFDTITGRLYQLTNVLTGAFDPDPAPDGRSIVFSWYQADGYHLARVAWDALLWKPVTAPPQAASGDLPPAPPVAPRLPTAGPGPYPNGWRLTPYSPWSTLRPRYWYPTYGVDWKGPQLGAATSGMDALGRDSYAAELRIGLVTGEPVAYLGYARLLARAPQVVGTVEARQLPMAINTSDPWVRIRDLYTALMVSWPGYRQTRAVELAAQHTSGEWIAPTINPNNPPASDGPTPSTLLSFWAGNQWLGPADHQAAAVQRLEGQLEMLAQAPGLAGLRGTAAWLYDGQNLAGTEAAAHFGAGVGGPQLPVQVGGHQSLFSLRAFAPGELADAQMALGLGMEWRLRLAAFRYGMGDAPTFLKDLHLGFFGEGVAGWNPSDDGGAPVPAPWEVAADLGVELRLRLDLDYGRQPLTVRAGVATAVLPVSRTRWYIGLELR